MDQSNQTDRKNYQKKESLGQMFYHSCLGKFVIAAAVVLVLRSNCANCFLSREGKL